MNNQIAPYAVIWATLAMAGGKTLVRRREPRLPYCEILHACWRASR
ncbi:hypothetical protein KCP74_01205 [Salmonella enterica subsp. enterica]|nr:hypothetical protein KCP74_01205 [Salmonella enterica subsp. enterica]